MKKVICVVGSQGGIGAALCERLQADHDIIRMDVDGPIPIDLADPASIERAFASARAIAPHIADMGNARNMPSMKNAKYFKQVAVSFSMDNLKKI